MSVSVGVHVGGYASCYYLLIIRLFLPLPFYFYSISFFSSFFFAKKYEGRESEKERNGLKILH